MRNGAKQQGRGHRCNGVGNENGKHGDLLVNGVGAVLGEPVGQDLAALGWGDGFHFLTSTKLPDEFSV